MGHEQPGEELSNLSNDPERASITWDEPKPVGDQSGLKGALLTWKLSQQPGGGLSNLKGALAT